jgi:hypothetical protein
MSRMLAILSATGLVLCAAFLGLAFLIGGDDVLRDQRSLERIKPLIDLATRKEWRWDGGDTLALNAPVNVRYEPKGPPGVSVTGPAELMKDVRVGEGRIASEAPRHSNGRKLEAVVSGIAIRKFVVNGGENLNLGHIDQRELDVHLNGAGTVSGEGRVDELNLVIAGPGNADLGKLSVTADAKVSILGNGTASLAPKGNLRLFIAGNGRLSLLSQPKTISRTILGSGDVGPAPVAPEPPPPPPPLPSMPPPPPPPPMSAQIEQQVHKIERQVHKIEQQAQNIQQQAMANAKVYSNTATGEFVLSGSRDTNFGRIERESARISVMNSGTATAEGKVDRLTVNVMGSGKAQLGKLSAREILITVAGSGEATIAPGESANITILGSGKVYLQTRPQRIDRRIMGSGEIVEAR